MRCRHGLCHISGRGLISRLWGVSLVNYNPGDSGPVSDSRSQSKKSNDCGSYPGQGTRKHLIISKVSCRLPAKDSRINIKGRSRLQSSTIKSLIPGRQGRRRRDIAVTTVAAVTADVEPINIEAERPATTPHHIKSKQISSCRQEICSVSHCKVA